MRIRGVLKIVGPVIMSIGIAMACCSLVSWWYGESMMPLASAGFGTLAVGTLCMATFRHADVHNIGMREGCAVVSLSWLFACMFGALPFYFMGNHGSPVTLDWTKSFYEAVSGFTTTGASILTDVEIVPKGIIFWRSFTHWLGGMGIVVLAVAILPKLGVGGMQAFRWESPGPLKADKLVPRVSETAKILYTVYLAVTVVEVLLLVLAGVKVFDALCYTFGTVGTGGFGIHNTSVAGLQNPMAEWIIAIFMWLSGVNFALTYVVCWKGNVRALLKDTEWHVYTLISLGGAAIIACIIGAAQHLSPWTALRIAFFQVSTIITTTGYATTDFVQWPAAALGILCIYYFIGGCTGSTGGGPKVLRHIISWKFIHNELLKLARPNLITTVKVGGRAIEQAVVSSVMGLLLLYFTIFFFGGVALAGYGYDLVTAFSASIAHLGNIGPGLAAAVGPAGNFGHFSTGAIWLLSGLMLLGRLEVFTVLVLLTPAAWRSR